MQIRPVGAEFFLADRQKGRRDQVNIRCSQFFEDT